MFRPSITTIHSPRDTSPLGSLANKATRTRNQTHPSRLGNDLLLGNVWWDRVCDRRFGVQAEYKVRVFHTLGGPL